HFWHWELEPLTITRLTERARSSCAATRDARSWHQHGLDDLAGVHGGERLLPLVELPLAADDRIDVQLPGREQLNHPLPNRPVVTETALQPHVLLHQRIQ